MSFADAIQVAVEALLANKLRAALTMLGIVIGVGAVIALMAVGQGSQKAVTDQIEGLGSNLLFIRPGSTSSGGVRQGAGTAQTLTADDGDAILQSVPNVQVVAPQVNLALQISAGSQNTFTPALGVTPEYATAYELTPAEGDFITQNDVDQRSHSVVLGSTVAQTLFPDGGAVGQQIRLGLGKLVVYANVEGVLASKGGNSSSSLDNQILLPLTTVQTELQSFRRDASNATVVGQLTVKVASKNDINNVKTSIDALLQERHQVAQSDVTIESQEDIASTVNQVSQTMTVLLGSIAGISLVVGGIGIMNIMLVSVTERTREIGIRKAVGARESDILMQFLTEALTVTVLGGLIGVASGIGVAHFLNGRDIAGLGSNVQTVVSLNSVVIAFAVSAAIGVFFGLYPARRAAKLRPIEALRYE
ncbi:MAG TPA: ABC transporter permease [Dehalococcoidia bacterium]|nr:ABC transporter permease [Dehalococcoidia bacterium]